MTQKQMVEMLCEKGIRPTTQRLAVYDYLYRHRIHPSADMVYEALVKKYPTFSKTTVYNSLHALVEAGVVLELAMDTGERHYDADTTLHGHFHCRYCGGIADFTLDERLVTQLIPDGFRAEGKGIYFSGKCPGCSEI